MAKLKTISIQVQPDRDESLDIEFVSDCLKELGFQPEIDDRNDCGRYINYKITTESIYETWNSMKSKLLENQAVANTTIICCEGENSWDNYLLLHHYDKTEAVDEL